MESSYLIKISYKKNTRLPVIKWQDEEYPDYDQILDKIRYLAKRTNTTLSFFEKFADVIVEEIGDVYNCPPVIYSLRFPENYRMSA